MNVHLCEEIHMYCVCVCVILIIRAAIIIRGWVCELDWPSSPEQMV